MKKLIDIDENNLCEFRKIVSCQFPEFKITDKQLVNLSIYLNLNSDLLKKGSCFGTILEFLNK